MTTSTDNPIEAVRARLDGGRRWNRPGAIPGPGGACLLRTMTEACGGINQSQPVVDAVRSVIVEQYADRTNGFTRSAAVWHFNDHPDTTWADVDLVLDKASVAWDEAVR